MELPTFQELPHFKEFSGCAWGVWNELHKPHKDQLGTINLLTPDVVQQAAKEEIKSNCIIELFSRKTIAERIMVLTLSARPINFPEKPMFHRQGPHIESLRKNTPAITDDVILIVRRSLVLFASANTPKEHPIRDAMGWPEALWASCSRLYYNNTPAHELPAGNFPFSDPTKLATEENQNLIKLGIHNWAQHGICGRGVLLDLVKYYTESGSPLPYDPRATHAISEQELEACAKKQGVEFRQGDILLLRVGFIQRYNASSQSEKDELSQKSETFAGIEQSEKMKEFLWDNHFAAVASDQPALEAWPPKGHSHLHQTLLALWGMPIGEFFDLEGLSKICAETGRYTFFFSSWPLNILGGVASPPNAAAYF